MFSMCSKVKPRSSTNAQHQQQQNQKHLAQYQQHQQQIQLQQQKQQQHQEQYERNHQEYNQNMLTRPAMLEPKMMTTTPTPTPALSAAVAATTTGAIGKQIKGGYLLRYKKQLLWNRWAEEWVVLYDDSTMAWFTEPGRSSPAGKILVKEAPEMLAIAHWTGQIPRRPPLPEGCTVSQLIALGSRRKRSKVYWMLAKSEQEVSDWIDAITKTLPPPPQIELVVDKPHLMNVLRRPLVRIRPATTSEVKQRKVLTKSNHPALAQYRQLCLQNPLVKSDAAVAILSKKPDSKASLACMLPWGHGWGWATLPNGVWSGGLTWSQCEDTFTLHALPTTHCTNLVDASCSGAVYHTDIGGFDFHSTGVEDLGGEDFDYAMDCGDFIF